MQRYDVLVVGQGYTGLKVAKLAAERGLSVAAVEKMFPGGLIMSVNHLDCVPPGEEPSGPDLTAGLSIDAMDAGVEMLDGPVTGLAQDGGDWRVETEGDSHVAAHVVIASGARLRRLGVPGEEGFIGRGISECADCDGPLYHGKEAVVIGGGDSAFQEAVALTAYAAKVTLLMRGSTPRARAALVTAAEQNMAIEIRRDAPIAEIVGDDAGVTGVLLASGEIVPCAVVFPFVGLAPDVAYVPATVARDAAGALITGDDLRTALPGLWAVGAARSGYGGTLIHASADAERVVAAL